MIYLHFFVYKLVGRGKWHWILARDRNHISNHFNALGEHIDKIRESAKIGRVVSWLLQFRPLSKDLRRRYIADLSQMVHQGNSLAQAAILLADNDYPAKLLLAARSIRQQLRQGGKFSAAVSKQRGLFNSSELVMVKLSEQSGYELCSHILNMINQMQRLNYGLNRQLIISIFTRVIRLSITLYLAHIITANLFKYILMQLWIGGIHAPTVSTGFYRIFNQPFAKILMIVGSFLLAILILGWLGRKFLQRPFSLRLPVVGKMIKNLIAIRFFSALYPRLFTKWPFVDALAAASQDIPYPFLRKEVNFLANRVRFGALGVIDSIKKISFLNVQDKVSLQVAIDQPMGAQDFINDLTEREVQASKLRVGLFNNFYLALEVIFISWFLSATASLFLVAYIR